MNRPTHIDPDVLEAWNLCADSVRPLGNGLINRTFSARETGGTLRVLQQLNPMFLPEVHEDIEAVTTHLAARGLATPRLLRTRDDRLCIPSPTGTWRVMTFIPGQVVDTIAAPWQAEAAGRLLARFHRALDDLTHEFRHRRPPVHELVRHLSNLEKALANHPKHPLHAAASATAQEIFLAAEALPPLPDTPTRIVHGDPKISNLVFDERRSTGQCLLDLDTIGRMALPLELGDALRSWCSVDPEDDSGGRFSVDYFAAAVSGYARESRGWWLKKECEAVLPATATIQVELAARYCADSLNESYFAWNASRFASQGAHNLVRARGQIARHRSLRQQWDRLATVVATVTH